MDLIGEIQTGICSRHSVTTRIQAQIQGWQPGFFSRLEPPKDRQPQVTLRNPLKPRQNLTVRA